MLFLGILSFEICYKIKSNVRDGVKAPGRYRVNFYVDSKSFFFPTKFHTVEIVFSIYALLP